MSIDFAALLGQVRDNPANHNRWKRLADYPAESTAKMTASRLRRRYESNGFVFKVVKDGRRFAVGVLLKVADGEGRIEQA